MLGVGSSNTLHLFSISEAKLGQHKVVEFVSFLGAGDVRLQVCANELIYELFALL